MSVLLNTLSVVGTFMLFFGLLFLIQRFTIGLIPFFKKPIGRLYSISIGDLSFSLTSLIFIFAFIDFYKPY